MRLTLVIPTRQEARHIGECVATLKWAADTGQAEILVVDNFSTDHTAELARDAGARVLLVGPERSAQRNAGIREAAGVYVFFVDADMRVPRETLAEVLDTLASTNPPDALYVRETMVGNGFWVQVRNFERSFYDGTCIDGLRVVRRDLLLAVGGFDDALYAGEDWDLDRRILSRTARVAITRGTLYHHEGEFSLWKHLRKKRYYAGNFGAYCRKWNHDAVIRRQFGLKYRLWTVFMEHGKWRRSLRRPDRLLAIWFYKVAVGAVFWLQSRKSPPAASTP